MISEVYSSIKAFILEIPCWLTDLHIFILLQIILLLCVVLAIFQGQRNNSSEAEVVRGDKSMNALYVVYAASVATILVLIDNVDDLKGYKIGLILLDFSCVTYLFLSSWFRNIIFFPLMGHIRKD